MRGLFVTGTDTGVGKTFLTGQIAASLLARGISVGIYKPVCSGADFVDGTPRYDDVERHFVTLNGQFPRERICPQRFPLPLAPPLAARLAGQRVDGPRLRSGADWWRGRVGALIVEGAGGFLSPLSEVDLVADLAVDFQLPVLVVARLGLGTLNHTLLTVEAIQARGLTVAGIVLNHAHDGPLGLPERTNPEELQRLTRIPVLAVVRYAREDRTACTESPVEIDMFDEPGTDAAQSGLRPADDPIRIDWFDLMREPGGVPPRTLN